MKIEEGWRLQSVDFSVQANGKDSATGIVTLVRAPAEKARWHQMPEDLKEADNGPPLYVIGNGMALEDAVASANIAAAHAKPIPDAVVEMDKCVWTEDDDGAWDTSCDNRFEFTEDGPEENDFAFCPYCGKKLEPICCGGR